MFLIFASVGFCLHERGWSNSGMSFNERKDSFFSFSFAHSLTPLRSSPPYTLFIFLIYSRSWKFVYDCVLVPQEKFPGFIFLDKILNRRTRKPFEIRLERVVIYFLMFCRTVKMGMRRGFSSLERFI